MSGVESDIVTVSEATPEQCRALALDHISQAVAADSFDHMAAHLESALIWARGADFPQHVHSWRPSDGIGPKGWLCRTCGKWEQR